MRIQMSRWAAIALFAVWCTVTLLLVLWLLSSEYVDRHGVEAVIPHAIVVVYSAAKILMYGDKVSSLTILPVPTIDNDA